MYEAVVSQLQHNGMLAELWFFADDSGFGNLPDMDRQRLIDYGMARLSSFPSTLFVLASTGREYVIYPPVGATDVALDLPDGRWRS